MTYDALIDTTGLLCPLPVLKIAKQMRAMAPGTLLHAQTDDPAALIDVPHFCAEQNYRIEDQTSHGSVHTWLIRKPLEKD